MEDKAFVKNAADQGQVKSAASKVKLSRDRELSDVAIVMSTPQGRRFMWRLLSHCKTYGSVWEPSAKIHYNAGQQDVGHFLMAEIVEANEDAYVTMAKEAKEIKNG